MSNDGVNAGRRRFLVAATSVVGAAGAAGAAIPFLGSWAPSARAKAAGAPVRVNISKVEPGQQVVAEWRGQPVFVLHRTPEIMEGLKKLEPSLADPGSKESDQPAYVNPEERSIKPELLIVLGVCTHLGCAPTFRPEVAPADLGPEWVGGYFCACCCRSISNRHTAVAEATLSDSPTCIGMVSAASACASNSALKPAPSLPISQAVGRLKSCW